MLHTQPRQPNTHLNAYRKAGKIPAIVYGHRVPSVPILVDKNEFLKLIRGGKEASLIDLHVGDESIKAVLQARQAHPVLGEYLHLDFYRIRMDEKMHTKVHFTFTGEAPAVKRGGVLVKNKDFIDIECLPRDFVSHISVDLSCLTDIHSSIKVRDLPIPQGVVPLAQPDDIVVTISEMKETIEDAAIAAQKEKEQIEKLGTKPEEKKEEEGESARTAGKEGKGKEKEKK